MLCFFVFLVSRDYCVTLPHGSTGCLLFVIALRYVLIKLLTIFVMKIYRLKTVTTQMKNRMGGSGGGQTSGVRWNITSDYRFPVKYCYRSSKK